MYYADFFVFATRGKENRTIRHL